MTTLIAVYNSDGCIGRCDTKCHNAKGPVCTCICGGVNHGVGFYEAQANTREIIDEDMEAWIQGVDPEGKDHRVVRQGVLLALE